MVINLVINGYEWLLLILILWFDHNSFIKTINNITIDGYILLILIHFGWLLWPPSRAAQVMPGLPPFVAFCNSNFWVCLRSVIFVLFPMENIHHDWGIYMLWIFVGFGFGALLSKSKHRREPAYRFRCSFPPSVQTYAEKTNERYAEKVWSTLW